MRVRFAAAAGLGVGVHGHRSRHRHPCDRRPADQHLADARGPGRPGRAAAPGSRPATCWEDVDRAAAAPHGLAGLPGSSPGVGVVGYTLGGGFGWLGRRYGLAAHSRDRAEIVTADGDLIAAIRTTHPELFWGVCAAAPATSASSPPWSSRCTRCRRCTPATSTTRWTGPRDVLEFFADWSRRRPHELTAAVTFRTFPPLPTVPEPLRGAAWSHCAAAVAATPPTARR